MTRQDSVARAEPLAHMEPSRVYFTPQEVAAILRLSVKSIYRLVKAEPTLPTLKIGGALRFPAARLERWLRSREQGQRMNNQLRSVANPASPQEPDGA